MANKSKNNSNNKSSANKVNDNEQEVIVEYGKGLIQKKSSSEAKKNSKVKKSGFGKSFRSELKKVSWPTRNQVVNNTMAVIFIVLIVTAVVFCLDLAFGAMNKYGIEGVKALVQTQDESEEEVVTNVSDTEDSESESGEEDTSQEESTSEENKE